LLLWHRQECPFEFPVLDHVMTEPTANVQYVEKALHSEPTNTQANPTWIEVVEALLLALVAVSTAWSGFEATKWSGYSTDQMSLGLRTTVLAQSKATLAGQDRLYDVFTFNDWLRAKADHNERLVDDYQRRFRPAWRWPPVFSLAPPRCIC
jgi:hypothetical protein